MANTFLRSTALVTAMSLLLDPVLPGPLGTGAAAAREDGASAVRQQAVPPVLLQFFGMANGREKSTALHKIGSGAPIGRRLLVTGTAALVVVPPAAGAPAPEAKQAPAEPFRRDTSSRPLWKRVLGIGVTAAPLAAMALRARKGDETDGLNSPTSEPEDRALAQALYHIAMNRHPDARVPDALQDLAKRLAVRLRDKAPLSVSQRELAEEIVKAFAHQATAPHDDERFAKVLEELETISLVAFQRLSEEEQIVSNSLVEITMGRAQRRLTAAQLDLAEHLIGAAIQRQALHDDLDRVYGDFSVEPVMYIGDWLTRFDEMLRSRWPGPDEYARFIAFLNQIFSLHAKTRPAFLSYVRDRSPLRSDVAYGSPWRERYLVLLMARASQHDAKLKAVLEDALLHRNGLRMTTPAAVGAALDALLGRRRSTISTSLAEALKRHSALAELYPWWTPEAHARLTAPLNVAVKTAAQEGDVLTPEIIGDRRRAIVAAIRAAWQRNELPTSAWAAQQLPQEQAWAKDPRIFGTWERAAIIAGVPSWSIPAIRSQAPSTEMSEKAIVKMARGFPATVERLDVLLREHAAWAASAALKYGSFQNALVTAGRTPIDFSLTPLNPEPETLAVDLGLLSRWMAIRETLSESAHRAADATAPAIRRFLKARDAFQNLRAEVVERSGAQAGDVPVLSSDDLRSAEIVFEGTLTSLLRAGLERLIAIPANRDDIVNRRWPAVRYALAGRTPLLTAHDHQVLVRTAREVLAAEGSAALLDDEDVQGVSAESSFVRDVYDATPWVERQEILDGRVWLSKRAEAPGISIALRHDGSGSWSIDVGPGWAWRDAAVQRRRVEKDGFRLAWNAAAHEFSYSLSFKTAGGAVETRGIAPRRLAEEPRVRLILETGHEWHAAVVLDRVSLEGLAIEARAGQTGFLDSRYLQWTLTTASSPSMMKTNGRWFLHPANQLLDHVARMSDIGDVREEVAFLVNSSDDGRIRFSELVKMLREKTGWQTATLIQVMNQWLERDFGFRLVWKHPSAGSRLAIETVDNNPEELRRRVQATRVDFRPPSARPASSLHEGLKLLPIFVGSSLTLGLAARFGAGAFDAALQSSLWPTALTTGSLAADVSAALMAALLLHAGGKGQWLRRRVLTAA